MGDEVIHLRPEPPRNMAETPPTFGGRIGHARKGVAIADDGGACSKILTSCKKRWGIWRWFAVASCVSYPKNLISPSKSG